MGRPGVVLSGPPSNRACRECSIMRLTNRSRFDTRSARAGVCVELAEYAGVTHNFVVLPGEMPKGRDAVRRVAAWLQRAWT